MACFTCSGCEVAAWFFSLFEPPPTVEAEFTLPPAEKGKILVFVDDRHTPNVYPRLRRELTEKFIEQLEENGVDSDFLDYDDLANYRAFTQAYYALSPEEIGKSLNAKYVLALEVTRFSLQERADEAIYKGNMEVRVRFQECKDGKLIWPKGYGGKRLTIRTREEPGTDINHAEKLAREMVAQMADRAARLFFVHEKIKAMPDRRFMEE
jgi:hypothetical protein